MKIVVRYILRNKKRNCKTILCIAFSVMLMFSLIQMGDVLLEQFYMLTLNGLHRDVSITHITLPETQKIQKAAEGQVDAQMYTIWLGDIEIENKATSGRLLGLEGDLEYFKDCAMVSGRKPVAGREVIISQSLMDTQPEYYKIGNQVELSVSDEKNVKHIEKFTVCGVFTNIKDEGDMIFTTLLTADQLIKQWGLSENSASNVAAVTVDKENYDTEKIVDFLYKLQEVFYPDNSKEKTYFFKDRVLFNEQKSALYEREGTFTSISETLKILTIIIAVGMTIYIYGVFQINTFQKIRYLGIMRCLGGDKSTLAKNIFGESILISHVGILFGVLGGNLLNHFAANRILNALIKENYSIHLKQMWDTYVEVYLVALLPILFATLKVWLNAIKISPVCALNFDENSKIRKVRLFDKSGKNIVWNLTKRNIWRNRSQSLTIITVVSVALTLVLIITNTFCVVDFTAQKGRRDFCRYELMHDLSTEDYYSDNDIKKLKKFSGAKEVYSQFIARELDAQTERESILVVYSDSLWEKLLEYNSELKNTDYKSKPVSVAYSSTEFQISPLVTIEKENGKEKVQMPITGVCVGNQSLLGEVTENDETIKLIMNQKMAEKLGIGTEQYTSMAVEVNSEFNPQQFEEYVRNNIENAMIVPLNSESSDEKQLLAIIILASYIGIAFLIYVFSMIESVIEFNLINRRCEYGIMRALGMDRKLYEKLICMESISLGFCAVIIAVILSILLNIYFTSVICQRVVISCPAYICTIVTLILLIWVKSFITVHKNMNVKIVTMIQNKE